MVMAGRPPVSKNRDVSAETQSDFSLSAQQRLFIPVAHWFALFSSLLQTLSFPQLKVAFETGAL